MDAAESLVAEVYARWLQPRVGYFLEVDPAIAWERRRRQNKPALVEDLSILGVTGQEGFISFQSELGRSYRAITERWGWKVIHNNEGGASVAAAAGSILRDLEDNDLIPQLSTALT